MIAFDSLNFKGKALNEADFKGRDLIGADFAGASLIHANLAELLQQHPHTIIEISATT
jgi:uncharacterized protein YjbI with pentapeptide repeats